MNSIIEQKKKEFHKVGNRISQAWPNRFVHIPNPIGGLNGDREYMNESCVEFFLMKKRVLYIN